MRKVFIGAGAAVLAAGLAIFFATDTSSLVEPSGRMMRGTRYGGRGWPAATVASFVLAQDFEFPSATARVPTVEAGAVLCRVGAVTGSSTAWECANSAGASAATVTDPGTCTVIDSPFGIKALEIVGACAPSATSATIDGILNAAYTVVFVGMSRSTGAPSSLPYWLASADATGSLIVRGESGTLKYMDNGFARAASGASLDLGWGVGSVRWNGTTGWKSQGNDTLDSQTNVSAHAAFTGGGSYYFGTRAAKDLYLAGPLAMVYFIPRNLSDTEINTLNNTIFGVAAPVGLVSVGTAGFIGLDNTATTGNVDIFYPQSRLANASGLLSARAPTNSWAVDALAAATWTAVGTPTITSNVSSGPFAVSRKAAECDLIVDDDAANFEGAQSLTGGTVLGNHNASCYLKAGTSGTTLTKARISWQVAGGGTATPAQCDFTGLTSTAARKSCATVIAGTVTSIKASILVGNDVSDTGSIVACQCQLGAGANAEVPVIDNTARGDTYYTLDPSTWPTTSLGGKYEVVHTPLFDPNANWVTTDDTYYLFDAHDASDHDVAQIFGYTVAGRLNSVVRNSPATSDILTDGIGLTAGQAYASSIEWRPVGGGKCTLRVRHDSCGVTPTATCHATTVIASDLAGTATCPGQPTTATLANRFDHTVPGSIFINAVRVYSL